ncbi:MAG: TRAM domain-containing protein [Armatimonadetes bacterium]|nr:TRAM domain-containing protein [Armatimonadota bacterium]MDW8121657.1 TRAM domain-containing protein [Armatimonadota bacterium]
MGRWHEWAYRFLLIVITSTLAIALGSAGLAGGQSLIRYLAARNFDLSERDALLIGLGFTIIGVLVAMLVSSYLTEKAYQIWEKVEKMSLADKMAILFGVLLGLALTYLVSGIPLWVFLRKQQGMAVIPFLGLVVPIGVLLIAFSIHTLMKVRDVLSWPAIAQVLSSGASATAPNHRLPSVPDKLVDTSVIIDGRLADVVKSGFLEGRLVIPSFVLNELQSIADSADELKRARGQRGLAVLQDLKTVAAAAIEFTEDIPPEVHRAHSVDEKLIRLAKRRKAAIITNDNNLQKLARLQGVRVLSVNELATALKPAVLPGEELTVVIQRAGKEPNQGVGYLTDGTMVVVERGRPHIGHEVRLKVTSVLQSTVGKMIFGEFQEVTRRNVARSESGDLFDDNGGSSSRRHGSKA